MSDALWTEDSKPFLLNNLAFIYFRDRPFSQDPASLGRFLTWLKIISTPIWKFTMDQLWWPLLKHFYFVFDAIRWFLPKENNPIKMVHEQVFVLWFQTLSSTTSLLSLICFISSNMNTKFEGVYLQSLEHPNRLHSKWNIVQFERKNL